jgi:hypothetical protein
MKKIHHNKRLVEWLKVKALSSSPRTMEEKKNDGYSIQPRRGDGMIHSGIKAKF